MTQFPEISDFEGEDLNLVIRHVCNIDGVIIDTLTPDQREQLVTNVIQVLTKSIKAIRLIFLASPNVFNVMPVTTEVINSKLT